MRMSKPSFAPTRRSSARTGSNKPKFHGSFCDEHLIDQAVTPPTQGRRNMSYQTIEVHNSTPHIGAEIRRVDLSNPLGNQQFQEVHDALMDRLVIFFRDQKLSIEQHMAFGRRFGKLHINPGSPDVVTDHPEVLVIKMDDKPN